MPLKEYTIKGAAVFVIAMLIYKFGDLLEVMFDAEVAAGIVEWTLRLVLIAAVAIASIVASWVITEVIKRIRWEDPKDWKANKGRIWLCSISWNAAINGGFLLVMFLPLEFSRPMLVVLGGILIWTAMVCGIGIAAYDVFVRRLWHKILVRFFPTKWVRTPDGIEERPVEQPSDPETEKTILEPRSDRDPPAA